MDNMGRLIKMFKNRYLCPSCPDSDCDSDCEDGCKRHYYNTSMERATLKRYLASGLRVPDYLLIEASECWDLHYFYKTMAIVRKYQQLPKVVEDKYSGGWSLSSSDESSSSSSEDDGAAS